MAEQRLIDANALDLRNRVPMDMGGLCFIEDVETAIEQASTVDAVPVVRCKDCKYYLESEHPERSGLKFCYRMTQCGEPRINGLNVWDEAYCSYGERKDDGTV